MSNSTDMQGIRSPAQLCRAGYASGGTATRHIRAIKAHYPEYDSGLFKIATQYGFIRV